MANIINTLVERIEEYRLTNKTPCKNYATEEAAEKATAKMAQEAAVYFTKPNEEPLPADYIVIYIESWGRWVGCINLTELLRRPTSNGGYLGFCSAKGFYCW